MYDGENIDICSEPCHLSSGPTNRCRSASHQWSVNSALSKHRSSEYYALVGCWNANRQRLFQSHMAQWFIIYLLKSAFCLHQKRAAVWSRSSFRMLIAQDRRIHEINNQTIHTTGLANYNIHDKFFVHLIGAEHLAYPSSHLSSDATLWDPEMCLLCPPEQHCSRAVFLNIDTSVKSTLLAGSWSPLSINLPWERLPKCWNSPNHAFLQASLEVLPQALGKGMVSTKDLLSVWIST